MQEMINRLSTTPTKNAPIKAKGFERMINRLNYSTSLVFTFLCATNHAKTLTLKGTFDFHKKIAGKKGTEFETLDKTEKMILLRKFLKRMVPKLSHLELKE